MLSLTPPVLDYLLLLQHTAAQTLALECCARAKQPLHVYIIPSMDDFCCLNYLAPSIFSWQRFRMTSSLISATTRALVLIHYG